MWLFIFLVSITNYNFTMINFQIYNAKNLKKSGVLTQMSKFFLIFTVFAINGSFASWVVSPVTSFFALKKSW